MYCCIDDNNTEIINNIVYMDLKKITYYINCVSDGFGFFGSKFEKLINDIDFENLPSNIQELNIIIINNNYLQHFSRVYKILVEKIKNVSNYVNINIYNDILFLSTICEFNILTYCNTLYLHSNKNNINTNNIKILPYFSLLNFDHFNQILPIKLICDEFNHKNLITNLYFKFNYEDKFNYTQRYHINIISLKHLKNQFINSNNFCFPSFVLKLDLVNFQNIAGFFYNDNNFIELLLVINNNINIPFLISKDDIAKNYFSINFTSPPLNQFRFFDHKCPNTIKIICDNNKIICDVIVYQPNILYIHSGLCGYKYYY
jgi:hypothetical protein